MILSDPELALIRVRLKYMSISHKSPIMNNNMKTPSHFHGTIIVYKDASMTTMGITLTCLNV